MMSYLSVDTHFIKRCDFFVTIMGLQTDVGLNICPFTFGTLEMMTVYKITTQSTSIILITDHILIVKFTNL